MFRQSRALACTLLTFALALVLATPSRGQSPSAIPVAQEFEGEVNFGVPHDIIYPHVPRVLQRFAADYPRMKVHLQSSFTSDLKQQFAAGEMDGAREHLPQLEEGVSGVRLSPPAARFAPS
jgi:DNA-binding transcriptional LysR family regulator